MVFAETVTYIDYNDIIVDLIIEVRENTVYLEFSAACIFHG